MSKCLIQYEREGEIENSLHTYLLAAFRNEVSSIVGFGFGCGVKRLDCFLHIFQLLFCRLNPLFLSFLNPSLVPYSFLGVKDGRSEDERVREACTYRGEG